MKVLSKIARTILTVALMGSIILANGASVFASPASVPMSSLNGLSGVEMATFDSLRSQIINTASGANLSTVYEVPLSSLGLGSCSWTAADLNVSSLLSGGQISSEAKNAVLNKVAGDYNLVISTLLEDCPYELFWYDKNGVSINCSVYYHYEPSVGNYVISVESNVYYYFGVAGDYAAGSYQVSPNAIARAQAAANNARAIVARYAGLSDYDKLVHYRDEICALVSYDYSSSGRAYGDPWQLISVFDGNPNTNVVCEGYSKAFKYLCDLTTFNNSSIACYTVGGNISDPYESGPHMINVIRMDDGSNYIVDLTNADEGSYGSASPFLSGANGSVQGGYSYIINNGNAYFTYDSKFVRLFNAGALTIHGTDYAPVAGGYNVNIPSDPSGAQSFIERLYTVALGRASDPTGAQYWLQKVMSGSSTGGDLARGFLFSQEFLGKNTTNEEFVTVLYHTFFDREPDAPGLQYWVNNLQNGMSRQDVINGFINSIEWYHLCTSYGIRSGSAAAPN